MIAGPVLGGFLSHPAKNFSVFQESHLFTTYPYLLPCIISAMISFIGFVIGFFYLPETRMNAEYTAIPSTDKCNETSSEPPSTSSQLTLVESQIDLESGTERIEKGKR